MINEYLLDARALRMHHVKCRYYMEYKIYSYRTDYFIYIHYIRAPIPNLIRNGLGYTLTTN